MAAGLGAWTQAIPKTPSQARVLLVNDVLLLNETPPRLPLRNARADDIPYTEKSVPSSYGTSLFGVYRVASGLHPRGGRKFVRSFRNEIDIRTRVDRLQARLRVLTEQRLEGGQILARDGVCKSGSRTVALYWPVLRLLS